jgi:hypothetical protein
MGEWQYSNVYLTLALAGGEWLASCSYCFTPREKVPGTHWTGGSVYHRAGLGETEKGKYLSPVELKLRPLGHLASRYTDYAYFKTL